MSPIRGGGPTPGQAALQQVQSLLDDTAAFRARLQQSLAERFPDIDFTAQPELRGVDTYKDTPSATLFNPTAESAAAAKDKPTTKKKARTKKRPGPRAGKATKSAKAQFQKPKVAASAWVQNLVFPGASHMIPGAVGVDARLSLEAEMRTQGYMNKLHNAAYYDYHLLENFWRVKDDERVMDDRASRERRWDNQFDEFTYDEARLDDMAYENRDYEYQMERMHMEAEEERIAMERDREYREEYRFDDD